MSGMCCLSIVVNVNGKGGVKTDVKDLLRILEVSEKHGVTDSDEKMEFQILGCFVISCGCST